ncbi:MAG: CmcI family methyltransferase [Bryobacteraceae bacterium]
METRVTVLITVSAALAGAVLGAWGSASYLRAPERVVAAYHRWYHANGATTFNNTFWLGIPTQKCPLDTWTYQEILAETKPDVLVETGTYKGGSSFFYASIFDLMKHGRIITVDIEDYPGKPPHERIQFLMGSSTSDAVLRKVRDSIRPGEKVMVALDSDHHKDHVGRELALYSPLVSPGMYLVVEDTHFNGHPILPHHGPGPMEAVDEFVAAHPEFVIDRSREKFGMTFNPRGWLKRVK